jgi:hypothetical protein
MIADDPGIPAAGEASEGLETYGGGFRFRGLRRRFDAAIAFLACPICSFSGPRLAR